MLLPIHCHGCSHRFQRTAAAVLVDDRCPRCASADLDVDESGWATVAAVDTPCPNCGEQVRFIGPAWGDAEQARYEDIVPWTCDGCGSSGTEEDLVKTAVALDPDAPVFTCPYCEQKINYLRDEIGGAPRYTCSGCGHSVTLPASVPGDRPLTSSKVARIATAIKDSNPDVPYASAVELAREAVRRFPSVVS